MRKTAPNTFITANCRDLLTNIPDISISLVNRNSNVHAHRLTREARSYSDFHVSEAFALEMIVMGY